MKKAILTILYLIVITNCIYSQRVVTIGAFNYYPAIFQDKDGMIKGFYVDAFHEIEVKENIKIKYVFGTWDEGLDRVKKDKIDMMVSVAYTDDRATYMDYSANPLLTVWGEVYVKKSSEIDDILSLEGKTIAVMKSDVNGQQLKILTEKMSINCTFIEKPDFQKVFESIVSSEVDAGVVNNTFGASKSEEFNIRSSGIVFNPFDIHLTVHKSKNSELLSLFDEYLRVWKYDINSVYNTSRKKWSHGEIGVIRIIPIWLKNALFSIIGISIILLLFIVLLRYRVKKATQKVKKSEALFKAFMENSTAFVYIKDESLNHIYRNQKVEELIAYSNDKNSSSANSIFDFDTVKLLENADRKILNFEVNQLNLIYSGIINNKKRWFHDYKFNLSLPNEKPMIGGVALDITKLKETEEKLSLANMELIKAKEKAEESDRLKSAFLANMSHEIRTPMNGILGFAGLLKEPSLSGEEQQEYINIIEKSGERMLNIINDIISISKIESGQMDVNLQLSNINEQLEYVYAFFKPEVEAKGIQIVYKNTLPTNTNIKTDREKVYAILTNLVKNAIKYSEKGTIELGYVLKKNSQLVELEFFVKDTGIGIPKNIQEAIFERFIQADINDKMARQGAGLGLSISKAYIEMLGGKIWVESEEGVGSTFYFTLPYQNEKMEEKTEDSTPAEKTSLKKLKILIAEDDQTSEMLLSHTVQKLANEIILARTGTEAVVTCFKYPEIDVVLMDIMMPEMDGYEATRQIRMFNKDIIIIAQTAYVLEGDKEKAIAAGCNDYISKPIKKEELTQLIIKCMNK